VTGLTVAIGYVCVNNSSEFSVAFDPVLKVPITPWYGPREIATAGEHLGTSQFHRVKIFH